MKKLLIILGLITIWNASNGQSDYFPLEKGASYTYAYGSELYQGAYDDKRFKIDFLNATKIIDGKEYLISETSSLGSDKKYTLLTTTYARVGKDGVIFSLNNEGDKEYVTMPAAPKVGDTWTSKKGESKATAKVTSIDATIETANKTYTECLVVEQTADGMVTRSYFKKYLGMVATTMIMDGSEKIFIYLVKD